MAAPRGRRSLLRRLLGTHGAALPFRLGVVRPSEANPLPEVTAGPACVGAQVDAALVREARTRAGRCGPGASVGNLAKILAVCGICGICGICGVGAAALWFGAAVAAADDGAPPAATTTTADAPPPDPYAPPVRRKTPNPALTHRAAPRSPPARVSTPSPTIVRAAATPKAKPHAKTVRRHRTQRRRPIVNAPPASAWLAPLAQVVRAGQAPPPVPADGRHRRYLWLAGIALATLAVAALSLHVLSVRYFDPALE
jgi:hypothetical protein